MSFVTHPCYSPLIDIDFVQGLSGSCCGMLFNSRGFKGAASHMGQQLEQSLIKASDGGKIPIVMDTSPCLAQMKGALTDPALRYAPSANERSSSLTCCRGPVLLISCSAFFAYHAVHLTANVLFVSLAEQQADSCVGCMA